PILPPERKRRPTELPVTATLPAPGPMLVPRVAAQAGTIRQLLSKNSAEAKVQRHSARTTESFPPVVRCEPSCGILPAARREMALMEAAVTRDFSRQAQLEKPLRGRRIDHIGETEVAATVEKVCRPKCPIRHWLHDIGGRKNIIATASDAIRPADNQFSSRDCNR